MMPHLRWFTLLLISAPLALAAEPTSAVQRVPVDRQEHILVSARDDADWRYLAFPSVVDLGNDVLVAYKRGRAHMSDPGSVIELVRVDGRTGQPGPRERVAAIDQVVTETGQWVRFPNGDLGNYIDAQITTKAGHTRIGLHMTRSTDGGRTFGPVERVGVIDGIEYGYAFEAVSEGRDTWMLAMTFSNLTGGKSVYPGRVAAGSVNVIHSSDNGHSWRFVRNLTEEFGNIPINESTLKRQGDGFLVSTRGYDDRQRLHLTDRNLKLIRQVDLTETYSFIESHMGRPRLFEHDGAVYLLGRNSTRQPLPTERRAPMQLCLMRVDPEKLTIPSYAIIDNAEEANVTDGYYACPYFRTVDGKTRLHVITYKGLDKQPPQIIRLEYLWDEVR